MSEPWERESYEELQEREVMQNVAQTFAEAMKAAALDTALLIAAQDTIGVLNRMTVPKDREEAQALLDAHRESVQQLHDVACKWLDNHDRQQRWLHGGTA